LIYSMHFFRSYDVHWHCLFRWKLCSGLIIIPLNLCGHSVVWHKICSDSECYDMRCLTLKSVLVSNLTL
jgi:hypothetical protein